MFRLPGGRRSIVIDEGPFAGASVEVEEIGAEPIRLSAVRLVSAYFAAEGADDVAALTDLYRLFVDEAQPTWELADHRGPIPPTVVGMWRLPVPLSLLFIDRWVDPPTTAVDEVVPPGPVRDELKRRLREKG